MAEQQDSLAQDELNQRQPTMGGGDYARGNIDKREGAFITASTIYGDVIGEQTILAPELSPRDCDNRQRMLKQVHRFWIAGVLEQSLYHEVLIALNLQTYPQAVSFVGPPMVAQSDQQSQLLPAGTSIVQVYVQANQRLLILGAPGAGKTTLLLDLTRTLLAQAEHDQRHPLPVVFNLTSWAQQRWPLERWLVQELRNQYGVSQRLAQQWLHANGILPLLDGLDEVATPYRSACVEAINTFCQEHGTEGIVVCSRVLDYEAIGAKLSFDAAVLVQPLDDIQLEYYLAWGGEPLAGMQAVLSQDAELRALVRTPLLLNILVLAYQGQRPEELVGLTPTVQRRYLFDRYVRQMFVRPARNDPKLYTRKQTLRWLNWLARRLIHDNQTVFHLELMQPWWLQHWWQHGLYVLFSAIGAAAGGAQLGIVFGLLLGVIYGLGLELQNWEFHSILTGTTLALSTTGGRVGTGLVGGLVGGLSFGLSFGLIDGLLVSLLQRAPSYRRTRQVATGGVVSAGLSYLPWQVLNLGSSDNFWWWSFSCIALALATGSLIRCGEIRPTETLHWSWQTLRTRWHLLLGAGLSTMFIGGMGFILNIGLVGGQIIGLVFGFCIALGFGFSTGFTQVEFQTKARPCEGIWYSLKRALRSWLGVALAGSLGIGLVGGVIVGSRMGWNSGVVYGMIGGLISGLISGPIAGLYFGGLAFVQHFALRLVLALCGYAPWNYPHFLEYAVERILLRRVGGSYIFVHRMLLEYFAEDAEAL